MKMNGKKSIWRTTLTLGRGKPSHPLSPPSKRPSEPPRSPRARLSPRSPARALRPARGARARPGSAGCVVTPWRRACPPSQRLQVRGERGLRSVSRGASASACFYFKTWRQLKTSVWCQYFFFFHSSTILRSS